MAFRSSSGTTPGSGASVAIPVPSGAAVDDIVVVGIYKENTAVVTPPAGFTLSASLATQATARGALWVYWKRLTAADTGSYTFSWTGSVFRAGVAAAFSGRVTSGTPFDGTVGTAQSTSTVATLNVSTSPTNASGDAVGLWTNFNGGTTWTPPTNYTEREDRDVITIDTRDAVASGSTGNTSATGNAAGFMKAFIGVLAPDAGSTPKSDTETGAGSDVVLSLVVQVTASDTGSGIDVVSNLTDLGEVRNAADTSSGADSVTALGRSGPNDPGTGSDTVSAFVRTGPAESGSSAEGQTLAAQVNSTDAISSTDAVAALSRPVTEAGTGSDTVITSARSGPFESGSAAEAATLLVQISASDVSSAVEAVSAMAKLASEFGSGTDVVTEFDDGTGGNQNKSGTETGQGLDAPASLVRSGPTDTGSSTESVFVFARSGITEQGTATDTPTSLGRTGIADNPVTTETAQVLATVSSSDSSVAVESQVLVATLTRTDQVIASESASLSVALSAAEVGFAVEAVLNLTGPPQVRDWHWISGELTSSSVGGGVDSSIDTASATVRLTNGREATIRITRLEA